MTTMTDMTDDEKREARKIIEQVRDQAYNNVELTREKLNKDKDESENNPRLNEQDKFNIRQLYANYGMLVLYKNTYDILLNKFMEDAKKLRTMDIGFGLHSELDANIDTLHYMLMNSEVVQWLSEQNNPSFTYSDLRYTYVPYYKSTHNVVLEKTDLMLSLYAQIWALKVCQDDLAYLSETGLKYIIGDELLDRYTKYTFGKDGAVSVTPKTTEQLQVDYNKAKARIEELYSNAGILDSKTKNIANRMLNELFSYYTNGYREIDDSINYNIQQDQETQKMSR